MKVVAPDISADIDRTRGVAALGVIWGHSMYGLSWPGELNGAFWVWVFLPLSGYLVGRGFFQGHYRSTAQGVGYFLWNRALRIVPLAWVALCIGAAAAFARNEFASDAWRQWLFAPAGNHMTLVGPLWTIATEVQFYLLAALLLPLVPRATVARLAILPVTVAASLWIARLVVSAGWDNAVQPKTLLGNLPFFAMGLLAAALPPGRSVPAWVKGVGILGLAAAAWYLQNFDAAWFWRWDTYQGGVYGGAAAIAVAIALVVTLVPTYSRSGHASGPVGRALAWCGVRTYGIYVYHAVLLVLNATWLGIPTGWPRLAWLALALPLAGASYRWFEKPLLRFKKRRLLA